MWFSKQSSIRCRGTRLGNSVFTIISVQNQDFSGKRRELTKVLGADEETQSHLHWQFLGIGKSCKEFFWSHCTSTPHSSETNWIAERAMRRIKEGTSFGTVAIRFGWQMVGGCHGVLLPSANHSRSLVWWETPYERRFGEPLKGPIIPFGAMVENRPIFPKTCEDSTSSVRKFYQEKS